MFYHGSDVLEMFDLLLGPGSTRSSTIEIDDYINAEDEEQAFEVSALFFRRFGADMF